MGLWESERLLMDKYVSRDGAVLDIGCGAGRTTFGLYGEGYRDINGIRPVLIDDLRSTPHRPRA